VRAKTCAAHRARPSPTARSESAIRRRSQPRNAPMEANSKQGPESRRLRVMQRKQKRPSDQRRAIPGHDGRIERSCRPSYRRISSCETPQHRIPVLEGGGVSAVKREERQGVYRVVGGGCAGNERSSRLRRPLPGRPSVRPASSGRKANGIPISLFQRSIIGRISHDASSAGRRS